MRTSVLLPPSLLPSAPPAFSADGLADFQSFLNRREHGKIGETMIGGEGGRCAGEREKAGKALRYELISAQEKEA